MKLFEIRGRTCFAGIECHKTSATSQVLRIPEDCYPQNSPAVTLLGKHKKQFSDVKLVPELQPIHFSAGKKGTQGQNGTNSPLNHQQSCLQ